MPDKPRSTYSIASFLALIHICPGCGGRRDDPTKLCLRCRMGLADD